VKPNVGPTERAFQLARSGSARNVEEIKFAMHREGYDYKVIEGNSIRAQLRALIKATFATNVKGTLFTVQKALPVMKDGGSIILTGSTAGITGTPAFSVYSASKAAVRNFARSWILDLAPRKIRVNVLAPGATLTPGWHGLSPSEEAHQVMLQAAAASIPLGRMGEPEDTARAALFLASDDSSFVNGSELFVDGGSAQV
jgi:NAD(P)-dependent dehydrogenase (short-subunit alcohol dehydrogenase family)